ncbi:2OG-Fe(II) oxygenase [Seminavis robusta]|uniref:2OG-Fe(II) oxygenase n=1 Tax=Seminavis robusta TaxID=568900 RepID=A0A9N8HSS8_9STRA|nr:2OG-Fe(II) oxygenase [Seminavis robusta]|eukprot:Sro1424_g271420.1 2OG-Fe(II) oxygenase (324) ;mRNA; f:4996-5967
MTLFSSASSSFTRRSVSLDTVGVVVTLSGCVGLLVNADRRGRAPLRGAVPARDGTAAHRTFTAQQSRELERKGFLIVDNFLTPQQVADARHAIQLLDDKRQFRASPDYDVPDHHHDDNDTIIYDEISTEPRTRDRALINRTGVLDRIVRHSFSEFATSLVHSDFQGFPTRNGKGKDAYRTSILYMPAQMQVNICGGTTEEEDTAKAVAITKASTYNFYHKHLDSAGATHLGELGLIGWLRSQHLRERYLTCIVYLNPDWKEGDGGCLRMYDSPDQQKQDDSYLDIQPLSGRMVIFSSSAQVHAVLATKAQRYACAVWLALKDK